MLEMLKTPKSNAALLDLYGMSSRLNHPQQAWQKDQNYKDLKKLSRTSRAKYLEAISIAYALWEQTCASSQKPALEKRLHREMAAHRTKEKPDLLQLILRWMIDYDENLKSPSKQRNRSVEPNRQYWSRDAAAIRYLKSKNVNPWEVAEFRKKFGGGVDAWSRQASSKQNAESKKPSPSTERRKAEKVTIALSANTQRELWKLVEGDPRGCASINVLNSLGRIIIISMRPSRNGSDDSKIKAYNR